MRTLFCFGEALIDFFAEPTSTPGAPRSFLQHAGGAPANVAVAAARLGVPTQFVGALGADMFGNFLLESLQTAGVGIANVVQTDAAPTALAFVALDHHGERSFSFYRPPAADLLFRAEDFPADVFAGAGALHVCSNSLTGEPAAGATLHGMRLARQAGALVSMDLNLRPMLWDARVDPRPLLWQALELADVVKLARNELEYLAEGTSEQAVLRRLTQAGVRWVVVTDGASPLRWYGADGAGELHTPRVNAIDTTAAGDAFVGGLLFHLVRTGVDAAHLTGFVSDHDAVEQALRFAASVGALAVTRKGAFAAMPLLQEVDQLLNETYGGTATHLQGKFR